MVAVLAPCVLALCALAAGSGSLLLGHLPLAEFFVTTAYAQPDLELEVRGDSLSVDVLTQAPSGLLPQFVRDRLRRGLPATVGVQVELWKSRSGWFDSHLRTSIREFRISRDAWTERYTMIDRLLPEEPFAADSLSTIETEIGLRATSVPVEREWGRSASAHWVDATVVVVPLALSDLGEVDDWLSGEIESGPLFGLPRGLFRIVRDLTGLGDRKMTARSERFRMSLIANDRVWIQPFP